MNAVDLTGRRIGRWTVLSKGSVRSTVTHWVCSCACGTQREVSGKSLRQGVSLSCGCRTIEANARRADHGMTGTPEFRAWRQMISRCKSTTNPGYKNYGGRGIDVCPRWAGSFEAFFLDVGPRPSPEHSIDRINTNDGYKPENVRWASRAQQSRNTRRSKRWIAPDGSVFETSGDLAAATGVSQSTVVRRVRRIDSEFKAHPVYKEHS